MRWRDGGPRVYRFIGVIIRLPSRQRKAAV
jgi:hypothetical protein